MSRIGEIFGSLGFGGLAEWVGLKVAFISLGLALAVLSLYLLSKKIINRKTRDNEEQKELLAQQALFAKG